MMMPMNAVINPPLTKLIFFGARFENPFAGATTLAAILVVSVAIVRASMETKITVGFSNFESKTTGSQIACPKIMTVADVTATPINE